MNNNSSIKKVLTIIGNIIFWLLLSLSLLILIIGIKDKKQNKQFEIFGYSFSTVVTDSMTPTIKVNDIIIIKDIDFNEIKVGDIIVYYNSEQNINVVHRVVDTNESENSVITRGDKYKDDESRTDKIHTTKDNYIGKVVSYGSFLGIGKLARSSKNIIFLIIFLIFLYILIISIINIIKLNKEKTMEEFKQKEKDEKEKMREELLKEIEDEKSKKA